MMIVYTTTKSKKEAKFLSEAMLNKKLAACVQRLKIKSSYMWKKKLCKEKEYLLIIKTSKEKLKELENFLDKNHSYEVNEFVALKADFISKAYAKWLKENL